MIARTSEPVGQAFLSAWGLAGKNAFPTLFQYRAMNPTDRELELKSVLYRQRILAHIKRANAGKAAH